MPIRWNPNPILDAIDAVNAELENARPFIEKAKKIVEAMEVDRNKYPQYVRFHLSATRAELSRMDMIRRALESLLNDVPKDMRVAPHLRGKQDAMPLKISDPVSRTYYDPNRSKYPTLHRGYHDYHYDPNPPRQMKMEVKR